MRITLKYTLSFALYLLLCLTFTLTATYAASGSGYDFNPDTGALTITSDLGAETVFLSGSGIYRGAVVSVHFGAEVTTIAGNFLLNGASLESVTFEAGSKLEIIDDNAFQGTNITDIVLPNGLVRIGINAFYDTKITEINIPSSVTTIANSAFSNCSVLTTVTFDANSSLETIGNSAFKSTKN